ncbi:unnamed protein product [Paramecium sonneborni]|uniref:Uncharacterized protein n=1 Tax=Paramecium sonneborni TaxID=65129 RepID=A0A8S1MSP5_9CILI|nr:unnamed protein product [Paramecium sonneborni]
MKQKSYLQFLYCKIHDFYGIKDDFQESDQSQIQIQKKDYIFYIIRLLL